jgi:hypothetical protein
LYLLNFKHPWVRDEVYLQLQNSDQQLEWVNDQRILTFLLDIGLQDANPKVL